MFRAKNDFLLNQPLRTLGFTILVSCYAVGCLQENPTEPFQTPGEDVSLQEITTGTNPIVSPRGTELGFLRSRRIYMSDLDGNNVVQLTDGNFRAEAIRWSPDGAKIGFVQIDEIRWLNNKLMAVDVASKNIVSIAANDTVDRFENFLFAWDWAPDNSKIAFFRYSTGDRVLKIIKNDGSGETLREYAASEFSWSPDGSLIAYLSNWKYYTDTVSAFVARVGTGTSVKLPTEESHLFYVKWTPSNNFISYLPRTSLLAIYDIILEKTVKRIVLGSSFHPFVKFSPDGDKIAYVYRQYDSNPDAKRYVSLYVNDIITDERKLLVTSYPGIANFEWASSSNELFYEHEEKIFKVKTSK